MPFLTANFNSKMVMLPILQVELMTDVRLMTILDTYAVRKLRLKHVLTAASLETWSTNWTEEA